MADKLDKPLDEILKEERISTRGRRGKRGGGIMRRGVVRTARSFPYGTRPLPRKNPDAPWVHDMFETAAISAMRRGIPRVASSAKLLVTNLHPRVNDADMKELFSQIGPVKKASVHYNAAGKSLGTAEVLFTRADLAAKAIETYNGLTLDGKAMHISTVEDESTASVLSRVVLPPAVMRASMDAFSSRGGRGRGRGGARRGGRGGNRTQQSQQTSKSEAELDADLDTYMAIE